MAGEEGLPSSGDRRTVKVVDVEDGGVGADAPDDRRRGDRSGRPSPPRVRVVVVGTLIALTSVGTSLFAAHALVHWALNVPSGVASILLIGVIGVALSLLFGWLTRPLLSRLAGHRELHGSVRR